MKTKDDAINLSEKMIEIGNLSNKKTVCILTNMSEPIGKSVGNSLEIIEAVDVLKGNMTEDIEKIIRVIGSYIIKLYGMGNDLAKNEELIMENVRNGKGYKKFLELVSKQGGDTSFIENTDKFEKSKYIMEVKAKQSGYVSKLDALEVGKISVDLGAGRMKKEDGIDNTVGIVLNKKISDKVEVGDCLAYIHANDEAKGKMAAERMYGAYEFSANPIDKPEHILGIIE